MGDDPFNDHEKGDCIDRWLTQTGRSVNKVSHEKTRESTETPYLFRFFLSMHLSMQPPILRAARSTENPGPQKWRDPAVLRNGTWNALEILKSVDCRLESGAINKHPIVDPQHAEGLKRLSSVR